jgi:hypothetical protein
LSAGAVNATLIEFLDTAVAAPIVGAFGIVAGVAELEDIDSPLLPLELFALTVNVYAVPLVKPVTVIGLLDPLPVILPGVDVAV